MEGPKDVPYKNADPSSETQRISKRMWGQKFEIKSLLIQQKFNMVNLWQTYGDVTIDETNQRMCCQIKWVNYFKMYNLCNI